MPKKNASRTQVARYRAEEDERFAVEKALDLTDLPVMPQTILLLELELQAEIDKYVTSWWLLREQDPARFPAELHRLLFERCRVDDTLAGARADMYREANRYAARFCHHMQQLLAAQSSRRQQALSELRRFYRLSRELKMTHIRRFG